LAFVEGEVEVGVVKEGEVVSWVPEVPLSMETVEEVMPLPDQLLAEPWVRALESAVMAADLLVESLWRIKPLLDRSNVPVNALDEFEAMPRE
jgi:hypothetical protein